MEKVFIVCNEGVYFRPDSKYEIDWERLDKVFTTEDKAKRYIHDMIKDYYGEDTPSIEKIEEGVWYTSCVDEDECHVCFQYGIYEVI